MHKVQQTLLFGKNFLKENGDISWDIDAKVLLMFVLNIDKVTLLTSDYEISESDFDKYLSILKRRANFEPVAYIINSAEFMSLPFYVDENVLIPRGDTEILVEEAISLIKQHSLKTMLDMCTGQGAIAISTSYYTDIEVIGADIDEKCIEISKKNAIINGVEEKTNFIVSDLFENIQNKKFDIIASNPPYISSEEVLTLMNDVKDYEPHLALTDGSDGLTFYRKITKTAYGYLNDGGFLLFEIGYNQKDDVKKILEENGFSSIKVLTDLNGHNRVVYGQKI